MTQVVLRVVCDGVLHHAETLGRSAEHIVAKLLQYVALSLALACLLELCCCFVALPIVRRVIYPARKAEYQERKYGNNIAFHSIVAGMCM